MTNIESNTVQIAAPVSRIYSFLSDFNNFNSLMPPQVTQWQATSETCSFNIQGMADIDLRMTERIPASKILMRSEGRSPVSFSMIWKLDDLQENSGANLSIEADLSPIMIMLLKGPLQNFVNILVARLKEMAEADAL